jgi:hypothetical protein
MFLRKFLMPLTWVKLGNLSRQQEDPNDDIHFKSYWERLVIIGGDDDGWAEMFPTLDSMSTMRPLIYRSWFGGEVSLVDLVCN